MIEKGTVRTFIAYKGIGTIARESGGEVSFHRDQITSTGILNLCSGDKVEFEVVPGPQGPQAMNIRFVRT
ncbi:cold-shock protein [Pendulispora albinea]|uniref:cold-shock protein n=1 Tax=Pendulispora albinea TaxID=2741071 RepID=UPI00374E19B4